MAHARHRGVLVLIAGACQGGDFLVQKRFDVHQPQRDQSADQFHLRIEFEILVHRTIYDLNAAQTLALLALL